MKIDRLIGILSVLLQKERVTAPELAEKYEVSRRTINRDIENLCMAGIPIVTTQGVGGGISIMEGYRMDRTILSSKDMQVILAGLRSLDSVSGSHYYGQLMEKLKAGSSDIVSGNESILIDLSSWNKELLAPKITLVQDAIELKKMLHFQYYGPHGEGKRTLEPYYLLFKWSSWYVYGYSKEREDFRTYKLSRMENLKHVDSFEPRRDVPMPDLSNEKVYPPAGHMKALFDSSMKWHLVQEFGINSFTELEDGKLLFEHTYADMEGLMAWMLSRGERVTLLEPKEAVDEFMRLINAMRAKYS